MPTYTQLQSEVWWSREVQPPTLADLCRRLREVFGVGVNALGSKGDNNHLYGYHRSRAWILNSAWSAYGDGDYSVQNEVDQQGDADWLCAVDLTPGDADTMITVCQRLDAAARAGQCPQLREWYGNVDGDQVVDGWDLLADRAATSDSSHLWHLHMSFLRGRAGDDHTNLFQILTGQEPVAPTRKATDMIGLQTSAGEQFTVGMSSLSSTGYYHAPVASGERSGVLVANGVAFPVGSPTDFGPSAAEVRAQLVADIAAKVVASLPPGQGGGPTLAQITAAVRAELDKTKLGA